MILTSQDLQTFIQAQQIEAEIVHLPEETPTVASAAAALNVEPRQIIKSVLFLADGEPLLVIANGTSRIARKQLADTIGMSRRRVKIASPEQVLAIGGFAVGTVPPFGHRTPFKTVVDSAVAEESLIYGGGGDINALLRLTPAELLRVTDPISAEITEAAS